MCRTSAKAHSCCVTCLLPGLVLHAWIFASRPGQLMRFTVGFVHAVWQPDKHSPAQAPMPCPSPRHEQTQQCAVESPTPNIRPVKAALIIPNFPDAVHCQKLLQHWLAPVLASGLRIHLFKVPIQGTDTYSPADMHGRVGPQNQVINMCAFRRNQLQSSPAARPAAPAKSKRMVLHHVSFEQHVPHPQYIVEMYYNMIFRSTAHAICCTGSITGLTMRCCFRCIRAEATACTSSD